VVGSYLKTCFAQRQSVLASPLLAWLLKKREENTTPFGVNLMRSQV